MKINDLTENEIKHCFANIETYLSVFEPKWVKYLDLGYKVIRLISYSQEFLPLVEKQLTYVLKDSVKKYDATIILWEEKDVLALGKKLSPKFDSKVNMRLRIECIYSKQDKYDIQVIDKRFSKVKPIIEIQATRGFFIANNKEENTYYYGVKNLEPEEFIKEGHIFVQFLNNILKTEHSNLVHGAVIGLNGNGILICARGQRGKSTLSVLSMMEGFEYVSDDYLILYENAKKNLFSSPIYSIITLSPKMYNELYDRLGESRFVSNNARKDKYVFNISNFHNRFRADYPIKVCIFPEIVTDKNPSIRPCSSSEKGRAIVQLIQSTLIQTQDLSENWTVKKIMNMIKDYSYFKFNLCHDIKKNTEYLYDFMSNLDIQEHRVIELDKFAIDVTFDVANILNTQTGVIYSMNKFATNIFENLQKGVSKELLIKALKPFSAMNHNIIKDFENLENILNKFGILGCIMQSDEPAFISKDFAEECGYKISFIEHMEEEYKELIEENSNELCIK